MGDAGVLRAGLASAAGSQRPQFLQFQGAGGADQDGHALPMAGDSGRFTGDADLALASR